MNKIMINQNDFRSANCSFYHVENNYVFFFTKSYKA